MQKRIIQAGLQGMNQDIINPQVNSRQAFELKNFRINATADSNAIELTSERSTKTMLLYDISKNVMTIDSTMHKIIGHCSVNNSLVLFVAGIGANNDMILHYKLVYDAGGLDRDIFRLQ